MNGNNIIIRVGGVAIAAARSNEWQTQCETIEVSSPGQGRWREHVAGRMDWSFTTGFLVLSAAAAAECLRVGERYTISFNENRAATAHEAVLTGEAILRSCKITATRGNVCNGSFQFIGCGPLTQAWPLAYSPVFILNRDGIASWEDMEDLQSDNLHVINSGIGDEWEFLPSSAPFCYFVRNCRTGRYVRNYSATRNEIVKLTADEGLAAELYVRSFKAEGGFYGMASTKYAPHNFTAGTLGLNYRYPEGLCVVYDAVPGVNTNSFWRIVDAALGGLR